VDRPVSPPKPAKPAQKPAIEPAIPPDEPRDEDYVYETYIRVPFGHDPPVSASNVGVLVINEEDEDLWQDYMESDEETDWDEEDSNGESLPKQLADET